MTDILELFNALADEDKEEVRQIAKHVVEKWIPQQGPQTEAYFSQADELLYGGSAGGGKTDLVLGVAINTAENAVIFRDGVKNLRDLENRAVTIIGNRDGFAQHHHYWDRGKGKTLEFGSLSEPGSEMDWQGRRRDLWAFDEASQMAKDRIQFVLGWAGTTKGVRVRVIYATNPPLSDEGNWLITWFAPWIDPLYPNPAAHGELRWFVNDTEGNPVWVDGPGRYDRGDGQMSTAKSRTFIPSSLADNAYLRDTEYRSRVEALPEPLRSAMLSGNFMAARVDHENQLIPSQWVRLAQQRWKDGGQKTAMLALGVDVAGGGADREVIARLHVNNWFDAPLVHKGKDTKDGPAVAGRILTAQRNAAPIAIDMTGGWGGAPKTALQTAEVDVLGVTFSEHSGAEDPDTKIAYGNLRAEMMWEFRLALDPHSGEDIALPPDPKLEAELTTPRWFLKAGKIQVESKEDIKKRLKVSTDLLDAYVIAWKTRKRGLMKRKHGGKPAWATGQPSGSPFEIEGW